MSFGFDLNEYTPFESRELLPEGVYRLLIIDAEEKDTKDNKGKRLNLVYQVCGGQYECAKIFEGLNIINKNPVAEKIARRILKSIEIACGIENLTDKEQLLNREFDAEVTIEPEKINAETGKTYSARNIIKKYLPAGTPQKTVARTPVQPKLDSDVPPWLANAK